MQTLKLKQKIAEQELTKPHYKIFIATWPEVVWNGECILHTFLFQAFASASCPVVAGREECKGKCALCIFCSKSPLSFCGLVMG